MGRLYGHLVDHCVEFCSGSHPGKNRMMPGLCMMWYTAVIVVGGGPEDHRP